MGKSTSNIFRAKRMIGGNGGSIGAILTNRVFDNAGDMTTAGLDFHYHPGNNYHLPYMQLHLFIMNLKILNMFMSLSR